MGKLKLNQLKRCSLFNKQYLECIYFGSNNDGFDQSFFNISFPELTILTRVSW